MSTCPKCGKESKVKNNSREYLLENQRAKVESEKLCEFCN